MAPKNKLIESPLARSNQDSDTGDEDDSNFATRCDRQFILLSTSSAL